VNALLFIYNVFSQDKIICTNGNIYECEITAVDTSQIELLYKTKGVTTKTYIKLIDVSSYSWLGETFFIQEVVQQNNGKETEENKIVSNVDKVFEPQAKRPNIADEVTLFADSIEGLNSNFVYLYSGNIMYGNIIESDKPFLGPLKIYVDSEKIEAYKVKFYNNETGFYANTQKISTFHDLRFTERVLDGKINFYENVRYIYVPGNYRHGFYSPSGIKRIDNYYNKGFDDLRKANYNNLSAELAGNIKSMEYLKKYQNLNTARIFLIVAGTASIIGSFVSINAKMNLYDPAKDSSPNLAPETILMLSGFAGYGVSHIIYLRKPRHLWNAVYEFNR
jgi:hypothetical protein